MTPRIPSTRLLSVLALMLLLAGPAFAGWPDDPTVNVSVCTKTGAQYSPCMVPDGAGGVFVTWTDADSTLAVQRISATGACLWAANGVVVSGAAPPFHYPQLVADGVGGVIVAWKESVGLPAQIRLQRLSDTGTLLWGSGGVVVASGSLSFPRPRLVSDGAGGAIVTWTDERYDTYGDIYAQRVSAAGSQMWDLDGVAVCAAYYAQSNPVLVPDGAGGAIVAWYDLRGSSYDIYAQRLSAAGAAQWTADGVAVCTLDSMQVAPVIVADDAGGAIIAWWDDRSGHGRIYAQRVSTTGAMQWAANGIAVCASDACQTWMDIAPDGAGGAILAWTDGRNAVDAFTYGVYSQRVNASGAALWTANGVALCATYTQDTDRPCVVADGLNGAVVCWSDTRPVFDLTAQRLNSAGVAQWAADGVPMCATGWGIDQPALASDGAGGALAAWADFRGGLVDIYAQRVDRWGCLGAQPTVTAATDHPADEGGAVDLAFGRSPEDGAAHDYVDLYWIWRQVPQAVALARGARLATASAALADPRGIVRTTVLAGLAYYWEYVGQVPATGAASYAATVATACDSVAGSNPLTWFMVEARNTAGTMWWFSDPLGGYSVDNLAPPMPVGFAGTYVDGTSALAWSASTAADFGCFQLHRGHGAGFVPGPETLIATTTATGHVDMAGGPAYYKLCVVDIHGNISPYAGLLPTGAADAPGGVAAALALSAPAPNPLRGSCSMRLALPRAAVVSLAIYDQQGRRLRTLLEGARPAGEHAVTWDGRDGGGRLAPSGIYFVRAVAEGRTFTHRIAALR